MGRFRWTRSARPIALVAAVLALAGAAQACGGGADPAAERLRRAESGKGDIVIGAAWPWAARSTLLFRQGLDLAAEEVNAKGGVLGRRLRIVAAGGPAAGGGGGPGEVTARGGVLGRRIRIVAADDHESVDEGRLVAQRFADDPDVVAVVGHLQSYVTIPAAPIYDLAGVVLLAPAATDPELTQG